jgi:YVTN family beta-propeller protein
MSPRLVTRLTLWLIAFCTPLAPAPAFAKEILYIHNTLSGEISKVAIPEHEVIGQIPIGLYTDYVAVSPDSTTLYVNRIEGLKDGPPGVAIGDSGELIAIDTATDQVRWRMPVDGMPHHMTVSKDGKRIFMPYYNSWWLAVIDVATRTVIKKIFIGQGGHSTKLSPDGSRLYVGSMLSDALMIIDTEKLQVVDRVPFDNAVRPFAITRDQKMMYVQLSYLHGFVPVELPSKHKRPVVLLPKLTPEVKLPDAWPATYNHGIVLSRDEKLLFANGSVANYVAVYSHPDLQLLKTIPVGTDPNYIVLSKDGRFAYVSNRGSNDLSIIDVAGLKEIKRLKLGRYPQRMVVAEVP